MHSAISKILVQETIVKNVIINETNIVKQFNHKIKIGFARRF